MDSAHSLTQFKSIAAPQIHHGTPKSDYKRGVLEGEEGEFKFPNNASFDSKQNWNGTVQSEYKPRDLEGEGGGV